MWLSSLSGAPLRSHPKRDPIGPESKSHWAGDFGSGLWQLSNTSIFRIAASLTARVMPGNEVGQALPVSPIGVSSIGSGTVEVSEDIHLGDAVGNRLSEIPVGQTGSAVKYQRRFHQSRNLGQARISNFGADLYAPCAVPMATARASTPVASQKAPGVLRIGIDGFVGRSGFPTRFVGPHMPQLRFYGDAAPWASRTSSATALQLASKSKVEQSYMTEEKPRSMASWTLAAVRPWSKCSTPGQKLFWPWEPGNKQAPPRRRRAADLRGTDDNWRAQLFGSSQNTFCHFQIDGVEQAHRR